MKAFFRKLMRSPTATSFLTRVVVPLRLLILTPVVLGSFSAVELDVFYLFGSGLIVFTVMSARIGDIFNRMLSYAYGGADELSPRKGPSSRGSESTGEPNWLLFCEAYRTVGSLLMLAAIPALLFAAGTIWWAVGMLTNWDYSNGWLWGAVAFGVANPTVDILFARHQVALVASGRIAKANLCVVLSTTLAIVVSAIVVSLGGGLFGLMATQFCFSWTKRIFFIRNLPEEARGDAWRISWSKRIVTWGWPPLWRSVVSMLAGMGIDRAVGLFLVAVGEPGYAARFLFAVSMMRIGAELAFVPLRSQFPRFARMLAAERGPEVIREALARMLPVPVIMLGCVIVGGWILPLVLELLNSKITFLEYGVWLVLGVGLTLRRILAAFAEVYALTNNIVLYLRTIGAGLVSIVFFWVGAKTGSYLPFALGLWVPSVLFFNTYSFRLMMELADGRKMECVRGAVEDFWLHLKALLRTCLRRPARSA